MLIIYTIIYIILKKPLYTDKSNFDYKARIITIKYNEVLL